MTTPDVNLADLEIWLPKSFVLKPEIGGNAAVIAYPANLAGSGSTRSFSVPAGTSTLSIDNQTRFQMMLKTTRAGTTVNIGPPIQAGTTAVLRASSETELYFWIWLNGTPNAADNTTTRIGVQVVTVP